MRNLHFPFLLLVLCTAAFQLLPAQASSNSSTIVASACSNISEPAISGLVLPQSSFDKLKDQTERLRLAGYAQGLLAWAPLEDVLLESNPTHAAFSITTTDWEQLAGGIKSVKKLTLYNLATESLYFAEQQESEKVRQFWKEMSEFYAQEAEC